MKQIVDWEGIGPIEVRKNTRAKRLILRKKTNGGIALTIPPNCSQKRAFAFIEQYKPWILKQLNKSSESSLLEQLLQQGSIVLDQIAFSYTESETNSLIKNSNTWEIYGPKNSARIADALEIAIKNEARLVFPERLAYLAEQFGFSYSHLKINKAKTRWGSCSSKNNINLSAYLVLLPKALQDYVMVHELCHTIHKNHSAEFWNLVEQCVPNLNIVKKQLREYRTGII